MKMDNQFLGHHFPSMVHRHSTTFFTAVECMLSPSFAADRLTPRTSHPSHLNVSMESLWCRGGEVWRCAMTWHFQVAFWWFPEVKRGKVYGFSGSLGLSPYLRKTRFCRDRQVCPGGVNRSGLPTPTACMKWGRHLGTCQSRHTWMMRMGRQGIALSLTGQRAACSFCWMVSGGPNWNLGRWAGYVCFNPLST